MVRSIIIHSVDEATGFATVTFIDSDGSRIETSITIPLNDDGTARTEAQVLDFLVDHWPSNEFERRKTPLVSVSSLLGNTMDIEDRLTARGK